MLLSMNQVTSCYGKMPILKDISVDLEERQCLCVLSRNGVGKIILLRSILRAAVFQVTVDVPSAA